MGDTELALRMVVIDNASAPIKTISDAIDATIKRHGDFGDQLNRKIVPAFEKLERSQVKLDKQADKGTKAFKKFNYEFLSVMFAGMALERTFKGLLNPAYELVGVNELWNTSLQLLFLPTALDVNNVMLGILDATDKMPDSMKNAAGGVAVLGGGIGSALGGIGQAKLGLDGINMALVSGPKAMSDFRDGVNKYLANPITMKLGQAWVVASDIDKKLDAAIMASPANRFIAGAVATGLFIDVITRLAKADYAPNFDQAVVDAVETGLSAYFYSKAIGGKQGQAVAAAVIAIEAIIVAQKNGNKDLGVELVGALQFAMAGLFFASAFGITLPAAFVAGMAIGIYLIIANPDQFKEMVKGVFDATLGKIFGVDAGNGTRTGGIFGSSTPGSTSWWDADILTGKPIGQQAQGGYIGMTGNYLMHAGEMVTPADRVGDSFSPNINITVNTSGGIDGRRLSQELMNEIRTELRMRSLS
jgi:hypothetical protein